MNKTTPEEETQISKTIKEVSAQLENLVALYAIKDEDAGKLAVLIDNYANAKYAAGAQEERGKDGWIAVETLPENSGMVLIFTKAYDVFVAHYNRPTNRFTAWGIHSVEINDIETTHWQPLPAPPQSSSQTEKK